MSNNPTERPDQRWICPKWLLSDAEIPELLRWSLKLSAEEAAALAESVVVAARTGSTRDVRVRVRVRVLENTILVMVAEQSAVRLRRVGDRWDVAVRS